jgi:chromosomal replication initiation ATPase DnaA
MTPSLTDIIASASEYCGVTPARVLGCRRHKKLVDARRLVIWNARKNGYSLPQIGEALNRHHTTILKHADRMGV